MTEQIFSDFQPVMKEDELLHPVAVVNHPGLTETSWFHFNIPDAGLSGELYVWFHTRLRLISTGIYVWRGFTRDRLTAEYLDYRQFMPFVDGQIGDYTTPTGVRVRVLSPLRDIHLVYDDSERGLRFDMHQKALLPPVRRAYALDSEIGHSSGLQGGFEQAMHVQGDLFLHGKRYSIDSYSVRDRSWNQV